MTEKPITLTMAQRVIGRLTLEKELLAEELLARDEAIRGLAAELAQIRESIAAAVPAAEGVDNADAGPQTESAAE